jgi:rubrerythrin
VNPIGELMFIENYAHHQYYNIINNAEAICPRTMKKKDAMLIRGYIEDHHIIPKSLSGEDKVSNKVWLTAAEHFTCHKLLTEMTTGAENGKMWSALWRMMNKQSQNQDRNYIISPEEYAVAREQNAKNHSYRMKGSLNPFYDKTHNDETKALMSAKKKGKSYEEIFGAEKAVEMRTRRSVEGLGKPKGKQTTTACPHCGTVGGIGVMKRWHGDRCKNISTP